jgi:dTDP-4-dehydrorhamnose 3,5-epimerase
MRVLETDIADIKLLKSIRHVDSQEFFSEVFEEGELVNHRIDIHFVQKNQTWSASKGVVRGLHFQSAQARLSGVTTGSIFDVRRGSSSIASCLGGARRCRLEPDLHTGRVRPRVLHARAGYRRHSSSECLLLAQARSRPPVSDPALSIARPVSANEALVSDRDRAHPVLSRLPRYFRYELPINSEGWGR